MTYSDCYGSESESRRNFHLWIIDLWHDFAVNSAENKWGLCTHRFSYTSIFSPGQWDIDWIWLETLKSLPDFGGMGLQITQKNHVLTVCLSAQVDDFDEKKPTSTRCAFYSFLPSSMQFLLVPSYLSDTIFLSNYLFNFPFKPIWLAYYSN